MHTKSGVSAKKLVQITHPPPFLSLSIRGHSFSTYALFRQFLTPSPLVHYIALLVWLNPAWVCTEWMAPLTLFCAMDGSICAELRICNTKISKILQHLIKACYKQPGYFIAQKNRPINNLLSNFSLAQMQNM